MKRKKKYVKWPTCKYLNTILKYLKTEENGDVTLRSRPLVSIQVSVKESDFEALITRLIEDELVEKIEGPKSPLIEYNPLLDSFNITKKGKRFLNRGGYQTPVEKYKETEEEKKIRRKDKIDKYALLKYRWWFYAGVVAIIYFILEFIFNIDVKEIIKNWLKHKFSLQT